MKTISLKRPSKAGLKYKNVFARKDIIAEKFEKFAADANTTVKTGAIYPYEIDIGLEYLNS